MNYRQTHLLNHSIAYKPQKTNWSKENHFPLQNCNFCLPQISNISLEGHVISSWNKKKKRLIRNPNWTKQLPPTPAHHTNSYFWPLLPIYTIIRNDARKHYERSPKVSTKGKQIKHSYHINWFRTNCNIEESC